MGYPRIGASHKQQLGRKTGPATCDHCGETVPIGKVVSNVDIQWSWFRGDDDVATVCAACSAKRLDVGKLVKSLAKKAT